MALSDLLTLGNVVKFDVYAQELGTNFNGVTVETTLTYATAIKKRDVAAVHQQVYSRLPAGTPNDPKLYNYVEVCMADGTFVVLGIPWIKENTIVKQENLVYAPQIQISSAEDVTIINQVLVQAGYPNITVTPITNS